MPPQNSPGQHLERFFIDRKSTRLNSSHVKISYAVFCLKKKKKIIAKRPADRPTNAHKAYRPLIEFVASLQRQQGKLDPVAQQNLDPNPTNPIHITDGHT